MKYRSKVVEIEAWQWTGENLDELLSVGAPVTPLPSNNGLIIGTLEDGPNCEAIHVADLHDFIVKGLEGEFYAVKPSIFGKKYTDGPIGETSDGYHTFNELYEHRISLWIALCRQVASCAGDVWRTELHSDGSSFKGWFVLGIGLEPGEQMTYHLPLSRWDECGFAVPLIRAPEYDGHSSTDVLGRIKTL